jgi:type III restriction enzyme
VEVSGQKDKADKLAKVQTSKTLWVPAVENHGGFGRWQYVEIDDPWNAMTVIRESVLVPST